MTDTEEDRVVDRIGQDKSDDPTGDQACARVDNRLRHPFYSIF